jgi:hypothetical protein
MTVWLIDDGPLSILALESVDTWQWPPDTLHVVHDVADAAKNDRSGRRQRLLAMGGATPAIRVHRPLADSPAAKYLLTHIRPRDPSATKNLGEDVAIAIAATELTTAVFVTLDKAAAFVALAELGPARVSTPLDVWHDLASRGLISNGQRDAMVRRTICGSALPGVPLRLRSAPPEPPR